MSELSRLRGSEGYGACEDDMPVGTPVNAHVFRLGALSEAKLLRNPVSLSVFQAAEWETRGCVRTSESPWGCPKYYDDETARACRAGRQDGAPDRQTEKELQLCSA